MMHGLYSLYRCRPVLYFYFENLDSLFLRQFPTLNIKMRSDNLIFFLFRMMKLVGKLI